MFGVGLFGSSSSSLLCNRVLNVLCASNLTQSWWCRLLDTRYDHEGQRCTISTSTEKIEATLFYLTYHSSYGALLTLHFNHRLQCTIQVKVRSQPHRDETPKQIISYNYTTFAHETHTTMIPILFNIYAWYEHQHTIMGNEVNFSKVE